MYKRESVEAWRKNGKSNSKKLIEYNRKHGPWNKGKKGLQIAWNKGLTKETDPRVKKYADKLPKARVGMKLSKEHRENIGKGIKGRPAPNKGIPISEKTRKKLSKLFSGKNNPFYGKKHSKENLKKMSINRIGKATGSNNANYLGFDIEIYKKKIINMYEEGNSTYQIGRKCGTSGGTIGVYLKKWGIKLRKNVYSIKGFLISTDGDRVRSYPELLIDNFLFENGIKHEVERVFDFKKRQFKCDFYIPELDMYIEYWGIYHNEQYIKRKEKKLKIYKKLGLNLFSIEWNEDPIEKLKFLIPLCAKKQRVLSA
ncbi:MAG TPA: NUMOD3 domain-containing DNA-binding protein [Candidatus Nanoarchaeia archaeon]|nr:NUMOD3 domain-containing DNA-binding protein [Candidatus Nanoarchaeia archaeon]